MKDVKVTFCDKYILRDKSMINNEILPIKYGRTCDPLLIKNVIILQILLKCLPHFADCTYLGWYVVQNMLEYTLRKILDVFVT